MNRFSLGLISSLIGIGWLAVATPSIAIEPGDIIVTTRDDLFRIDPATGSQIHVVAMALPGYPHDMEIADNGLVYFSTGDSIYTVDPTSGETIEFSTGGLLIGVRGIDVDSTGNVYAVSTPFFNEIIRIDAVTGVQSVVVTVMDFPFSDSPIGPSTLRDLELKDDDTLFVSEAWDGFDDHGIYSIDLPTSAITTEIYDSQNAHSGYTLELDAAGAIWFEFDDALLVRYTAGSYAETHYGALEDAFRFGLDSTGRPLIVSNERDYEDATGNPVGGAVIRVEPSTGATTLLTIGGMMSQAIFVDVPSASYTQPGQPFGVSPHDIIVASQSELFSVDRTTGAQTTLFDLSLASYPTDMEITVDFQIFISHGDTIVQIDPVSGIMSEVASGGLLTAIQGIAVDTQNNVYASSTTSPVRQIVRIDGITGAQSLVVTGDDLTLYSDVSDPQVLNDVEIETDDAFLLISEGRDQEYAVTRYSLADGATMAKVLGYEDTQSNTFEEDTAGNLWFEFNEGIITRFLYPEHDDRENFTVPARFLKFTLDLDDTALVLVRQATVEWPAGNPVDGALLQIDPISGSSTILSAGGKLPLAGPLVVAPDGFVTKPALVCGMGPELVILLPVLYGIHRRKIRRAQRAS